MIVFTSNAHATTEENGSLGFGTNVTPGGAGNIEINTKDNVYNLVMGEDELLEVILKATRLLQLIQRQK